MKIHIVQPGETIESVAERYGISVEKLLEANDLSESDSLEAGMKVRIPTGRVPVAQQTPAAEPAGERPKHRPEPPKKENPYPNPSPSPWVSPDRSPWRESPPYWMSPWET
ncbi:MAG: LysM peptidoglycan-binding domain-containing protein, partial [Planifilum fulgidum]